MYTCINHVQIVLLWGKIYILCLDTQQSGYTAVQQINDTCLHGTLITQPLLPLLL